MDSTFVWIKKSGVLAALLCLSCWIGSSFLAARLGHSLTLKDNFHSKASSICSFSSAQMISSKILKRILNCHVPLASEPKPMTIDNQAFGSGRARRDAATRAMQGWHSQRANGNSEVSDPAMKVRQNSVIRFCLFIDFV